MDGGALFQIAEFRERSCMDRSPSVFVGVKAWRGWDRAVIRVHGRNLLQECFDTAPHGIPADGRALFPFSLIRFGLRGDRIKASATAYQPDAYRVTALRTADLDVPRFAAAVAV